LFQSLPEKLLFEKEYDGVPVQVWEKLDRRELRFGNLIVQSAYSTLQPDCLLLRYTRQMIAAVALVPQMENILHIGLGGGSVANFIYHHFPKLQQTVIEINPLVIEVAYEYFGLPKDPRLQILGMDVTESIKGLGDSYDLIFLDAFDHSGASSCFDSTSLLLQLQDLLSSNGWLIGNFWNQFRLFSLQKELWLGLCGQLIEAKTGLTTNSILYGHAQSNKVLLSSVQKRAQELELTLPLRLVPMVKRFKNLTFSD
jgi:spermidine synthase